MTRSNSPLADLSAERRELLALLLAESETSAESVTPIKRVDRNTRLPLSLVQERMWVSERLATGSLNNSATSCVRARGTLDMDAFRRAMNEIVRRHEVFRTRFIEYGEGPVAQIVDELSLEVPLIDLRAVPDNEREEELRRRAKNEVGHSFDLSQLPQIRSSVFQMGDEEYVFAFAVHHITFDGWSGRIFLDELATLYQAFSHGRPSPLVDLPIQYVDFAAWQREFVQRDEVQAHLEYWKRQLGGGLTALELPTDRPRSAVQTFAGATHRFQFSESLSEAITKLARDEGVTPFMALLAAFDSLLHRCTGQDEVVVGSPVANRDRSETTKLIGCFMHPLVLRVDLSNDPSFRELLGRVRQVCLAAYEHQDVPFELVARALHPQVEAGRLPLFQTLFNVQQNETAKVRLPGLTFELQQPDTDTATLDLSMNLWVGGRQIWGVLEYSTELFDAATIDWLVNCFQSALESIVADPDCRLSELPISARRTIAVEPAREAAAECPGLIEQPAADGTNGATPGTRRRQSRVGQLLPASFGQERLWFFDQLHPGNSLFNQSQSLALEGPLDMAVLVRSLNELVRRHEVLRTGLEAWSGRPMQRIAPELKLDVPLVDLSHLSATDQRAGLQRISAEFADQSFDLAQPPLFRTKLVRLDTQQHAMLLSVHHAIADGWSAAVFRAELAALYAAFAAGQPSPLPELPVQYADCAIWQRRAYREAIVEGQLTYWKRQLGGELPLLELPLDHLRPAGMALARKATVSFDLPAELFARLKGLCRKEGATLFMALLAAFKLLLHRYTGQEDVLVDSPIAGRTRRELEGLIGFFVNSLALRTDLSGRPTFRELLARVRRVCLEAYAHQEIPFDRVVAQLTPDRYRRGQSLTPASFMLHQAITRQERWGDVTVVPRPADINDEFDLTMILWQSPDGLSGDLQYAPALFERSTVERMVSHFQTLLESIVAEPAMPIGELTLLPQEERQKVLRAGSEPRRDYSLDVCVHQLFEAEADKSPEAIAAVLPANERNGQRQELSYGELNRRANRLAHRLKSLGVRRESRVGICLDRSLEMFVAVLGVLKAGGAYVPLDASYSGRRLAFMLDDAQVQVLIAERGCIENLKETSSPTKMILLDESQEVLSGYSDANPPPAATVANSAYLMYTSGSTGRPKGSLITHRSLTNAYRAWEEAYRLRETSRHLQMASFSFDVFAGDLVRALCSGATLVLCPREVLLNPRQLYDLLRDEGVDCAEFVPAVVRTLVEFLKKTGDSLDFLRLAIVGSDSWYGGEYVDVKGLCGASTRLINSYGVAEATIDSTFFEQADEQAGELPADALVPIGRPFANTQLYVVDRNLQPCPIGVPGELCIGGAGLARGYSNRPGLTAERFIPDLFGDETGGRLYRTGDQARWLVDGNLEFLGRVDHQVKIRGFRIEPGEIEAVLGEHPVVRQAVVVARRDQSWDHEKYLAAYVVCGGPEDKDEAELIAQLRSHLKEKLPDYMVPAAFALLESLPLSPNGKIDRKALPEPSSELRSSKTFAPPATDTQRQIAEIWSQVLRVEQVGLHDNFFDLGAHSLLLVQVQSRVREEFGEEIPLMEFFTLTTVDALARRLDRDASEPSAVQSGGSRKVTFGRDQQQDAIAIIGMSGSYPGAKDIEQFWNNLRDGVESISFFSDDEHEYPPWTDPATEFVKAKGVMEGAEWFDAAFFGYTPEEAREMDPQHRVFLERAWEAIEDAGYNAESYPGPIAVYAGVSANMYLLTNVYMHNKAARAYLTDKDFVATRVSYKLNLRGPSVVVQSGCSTSLLAVCMACQSLLNEQCDMALAGGATIGVPVKSGYSDSVGAPTSSDGHCRAFDASATGFVPGSGAGVVLLKRISAAIEDGDTIVAVIKGFAVNNDGTAKIGYTAPSIEGQAEVISQAQDLAGVDPETITYIEAHGTGTELGDPIEIEALSRAFRRGTEKKQFCALGSVKTNIGHLDAAAGIAGLTKAVLALQRRHLPPSLHFNNPNPKIDFSNSPFFVNARLAQWEPDCGVRRAGVSSFGIGGTNAHVVLEEAPDLPTSEPDDRWQLLLLSARTPAALDAAASNLATHLETHLELNLADVAYTLQIGRKRFSHRRAVVCRDLPDACANLRSSHPERVQSRVGEETQSQVVFLFPGQSAQYPDMGRELYESEAVFRDAVDRCCRMLEGELGVDLREVIFPRVNDEQAAARLTQTLFAQPAIFVVEYALAQLWLSLGVHPVACVGHSLGEYVAACLAGVFNLEDALRIVAARSRLMNSVPPGAMLAVRLSEEEVRPWVSSDVALAAVNGPSLCVMSGPAARMDELEKQLEEAGTAPIRLHASHAFHSAMMDPILEDFRQCLSGVELCEPTLPYVSNVTGDWIEKSQPRDPDYWVRQLRHAVRFSENLDTLLAEQDRVLLEVGPGRTLVGLAKAHPACDSNRVVAAAMRGPGDDHSDYECLLQAAGSLWLSGVTIDWHKLHKPGRCRVPLPTYPFQRQRYWTLDDPVDELALGNGAAFRKRGLANRFYVPSWKRVPRLDAKGENSSLASDRCWLLFVDQCGLGAEIAEFLDRERCPYVAVQAGDCFGQIDERRYCINPQSKDDFQKLVQQLRQGEQLPSVVAHLWGVTGDEDAIRAAEAGRSGFYSLLYFTQALAEEGVQLPLEIAVVTDRAQVVSGDESIVAEKSLVQGPCRVLPQELGHITCRHVDVALRSDDSASRSAHERRSQAFRSEVSRQVFAEIASGATDEVVALRNGQRWLQTYEPVSLEAPQDGNPPHVRTGGVYLITGGLGGIGMALAEWLAHTAQAKLVLTARTPLPARDDWPGWLAEHDANDAISGRIRSVESLEKAGGEVLVVPADVCNEVRMREVVRLTVDRFGSLDGVVHAAGVPGGGVVQLKTREAAEQVFAPKVDGLRTLQRALDGRDLDFLVACSSLSSIAGGFGQIDYCAANAFIDAFAWESRVNGGPPVIAVNWNAWREVGMAVKTDLPAGLKDLKKQGDLDDSLTNADGVDALRRILQSSGEPQVAVSLSNLPLLLKQQQCDRATKDLALAAAPAIGRQARPELVTPFVESTTAIQRALCEIWKGLFGFEQIGVKDDFFDLGGHSLLALQMLERLRASLNVNLALATIFEHRTIESLAQHLEESSPDGASAAAAAAESTQPDDQAVPEILSLVPSPRDEAIPLSFAQEGSWFIYQMQPDVAFNIVWPMRLEGELDMTSVRAAIDEIARRHEVLRTTYDAAGGRPFQVIHEPREIPLSVIDLRTLGGAEQPKELRARVLELARQLFDLSRGPLLQFTLLQLADDDQVLLFVVHHSVFDGWSVNVFAREFSELYSAYKTGRQPSLPSVPVQYADYALWQRQLLQGDFYETQLAYWSEQLADCPAELHLPKDRLAAKDLFLGDVVSISMQQDLGDELRALANREGVTMFMLLLAAYKTLLMRYSGQEDVVVGTPIANRNQEEMADVIGFCVNLLPLRTDLSGSQSFRELMRRERDVCLGAYSHQELPFGTMVQELDPARGIGHSPFFQVQFALHEAGAPPLELPGVRTAPLFASEERTDELISLMAQAQPATDHLFLNIVDDPSELAAVMHYRSDLFDGDSIRRMMRHLHRLLEAVIAEPERPIWDIPILDADERQRLLADWSRDRDAYPSGDCIHQLIEHHAEHSPDTVAVRGGSLHAPTPDEAGVFHAADQSGRDATATSSENPVFGEATATYGELNRRANQLARHLCSVDVKPEDHVAIGLDKTPELLMAMLGVWKAGATVVLLDPSHGSERARFVLDDCGAALLLTQGGLLDEIEDVNAPIIDLEERRNEIDHQDDTNPNIAVDDRQLAYLVYTSGSTGRPKGVMVSHGSLVNAFRSWEESYALHETRCHLQMASLTFDVFMGDVIRALCSGATLVLCPRETLLAPEALFGLLRRQEVDCAEFVPAIVRLLLDHLDETGERLEFIKLLICGSDTWSAAEYYKIRGVVGDATRIINSYGVAEATIDSTYFEDRDSKLSTDRRIPIGRPFAGCEIYILDRRLEPTPVGVPGELYIGGAGLARGYLQRPDLTAERFVPHPFSDRPGARLYRTGDRARFLADGQVEFIGRVDEQIKIRGFRIEPGEVESAIGQHPLVRQTAVVAHAEPSGEKRLVAYLAVTDDETFSEADIRRLLEQKLPDYMMPSAFVLLEELPLSPSGKINRRALPKPDSLSPDLTAQYVAPATLTEMELALLWADVLDVERVGVNDNFFVLGGHSLIAARLASRIKSHFQIDLPLRQLFENPTVATLARAVDQARSAGSVPLPAIVPVERTGRIPLSYAQEGAWFLEQMQPGTAFNIPLSLRLTGNLNMASLQKALDRVIRRHEALRTTFAAADGQPYQVIDDSASAQISVIELGDLPHQLRSAELLSRMIDVASHPFDLSRPPLFRLTVFRLADDDHVLLITVHHIVFDGYSVGVFARDLAVFYESAQKGTEPALPSLPIHYADYAHWQRRVLTGEFLQSQLKYWQGRLANYPAGLNLITDRRRTGEELYRGDAVTLKLDADLSDSLRELSQREGVTLFMLLLTAFKSLLARYTGQADIIVGTPIANRNQEEMASVIGFCVNVLALRTDLSGNPAFRTLLDKVRETCLGAYAHQELPLGLLVQHMRPDRHIHHSPFFSVGFALHHLPHGANSIELQGLELSSSNDLLARAIDDELESRRADVTPAMDALFLDAYDHGDNITAVMQHSSQLFERGTVERMMRHFEQVLRIAAANPETPLFEIPLLDADERQQVLIDWNSTDAEFPESDCLHQLFEARADLAPDAVAVVVPPSPDAHDGATQLTYGELNRHANQLARHLLSRGVKPESRVGICMDRSVAMVIAVWGVLKAGAAFVALDHANGCGRLDYMLEDSHAEFVLTRTGLLDETLHSKAKVIFVDEELESIARQEDANLNLAAHEEQLAYVIYTSGSTGRPKGVMVSHRSLINVYRAWESAYGLADLNCHLQMASFSFDVFVGDMVRALCSGARLVLCPRDLLLAPDELCLLMQQHNVDCAEFVPAVVRGLVEHLEATGGDLDFLKFVIVGSDAWYFAEFQQLRKLLSSDARLINGYGIAEATIDSSFYEPEVDELPGTALVPIGRPFANMRLYVLDQYLHPVPTGAAGELYIGGRGLARGYTGRPDLTAERFIPDPFSSTPAARLYRTGDRARHLPDGTVEFLGRVDHQIKIRGFRIEPGEIEAVLGEHPNVSEVLVLPHAEATGEQRLVAYVAKAEDAPLTAGELREYLESHLPAYMVPSVFMILDVFPLTPSGKLDRRALPDPSGVRPDLAQQYVAPSTSTEIELTRVWSDVLGIERVGVADNFFALGGHSLLAAKLVSRVRSELQRDVPLRVLFERPTVARLARYLDDDAEFDRQRTLPPEVVTIQPNGDKPPLFLLHAVDGNVVAYLDLARHFPGDQPIYGVQHPGLVDDVDCDLTLEELAERYAEILQTVQTEGPYTLVGWSLGGLVAYELAKQLNQRGCGISLVALIDSRVWTDETAEQMANRSRQEAESQFGLSVEAFLQLAPDEQFSLLLDRAKAASGTHDELTLLKRLSAEIGLPIDQLLFLLEETIPADYSGQWNDFLGRARQQFGSLADGRREQLKRQLQVVRHLMSGQRDYRPQPFDGPVVLLRADDPSHKDASLGWEQVVRRLIIHTCPGHHFSIMREPHVAEVAGLINSSIEEVLNGTCRNEDTTRGGS